METRYSSETVRALLTNSIWNFWTKDWSRHIVVEWDERTVPLKSFEKDIRRELGKNFIYERSLSRTPVTLVVIGEGYKPQLVERLAVGFSDVLKTWLTTAELQAVNERNADYKAAFKPCCATHEFCDPNEAMLQAFVNVLGREFTFYNSDYPETEERHRRDEVLWGEAWQAAADAGFYLTAPLTCPA